MTVDSHLHVWSDDAARYPFVPGASPKDKATVEFLNETLTEAGVEHAVIVQPSHYMYDNSYVADSIRRFPGKFAAVALVDPHAADAPDQLEALVREQGFSGMRLHLGREEDPTSLAAADQDPLWRRVEELDICFIVLARPMHFPALEPIIGRFPGVKVVIDHLGQPPADEGPPYPTLDNVLGLAKYPGVYVKVSRMNDMSREEYPHRDMHEIVHRIYDAFGPERLMWGTDFPHVMRKTGYRPALDMVREHLDFLNDDDRDWLFEKTVREVWSFG
jgi:predicted TIM-barrel fold metal-dependent hydrolase